MFNQLKRISPTLGNLLNKSKEGNTTPPVVPQDGATAPHPPAAVAPDNLPPAQPPGTKTKGRTVAKQKTSGRRKLAKRGDAVTTSATPRTSRPSTARAMRNERRQLVREGRFSPHKPHNSKACRRLSTDASGTSDEASLEVVQSSSRASSPHTSEQVKHSLPDVFVDQSAACTSPPSADSNFLIVPPETGARNKTTVRGERSRMASEDCYNNPESIFGLLEEVKKQVASYPRLLLENKWGEHIEPRYAEIKIALDRLSKCVIMNNFTDVFAAEISTLSDQLDQERKRLLENLQDAANTHPQGSVYRSYSARNVGGPETHGASHPPSEADDSSFHGWTAEGEIQDMESRVTKLEYKFRRHRQDSRQVAKQVSRLVDTASVQIATLVTSIEDQSNQIDSLATDLGVLNGKLNLLQNPPIPSEVAALSARLAKLEQLHMPSPRPLTLKEVDNRIMSALASHRLPQESPDPTPLMGGAAEPRGRADQAEKSLQFEVNTLKKITKDLEDQLRDLEQQHSSISPSTMRVSSTPINNSAQPRETSILEVEYLKRSLEKKIERLERLTSASVCESTDITEIRKRHSVDLPKVQRLLEEFTKGVSGYCKGGANDAFYRRCLEASDQAEAWMESVESLYDKKDIHAVDTEKDKGNAEVTPFSGDHTQTIFEFLDDFESAFMAVGTSKRRANLMYKKYLTDWIRLHTSSLMNDYSELKAWLVEQYGAAESIAKVLVEYLESLKKPTGTDSDKLTFYITISHTLTRFERLETLPQLPELKTHIQSWHVLDRLVGILPKADDNAFMKVLRDHGLSTKKMQGPYVLAHLKQFVLSRVDDLRRNVERESKTNPAANKPKAKVALVATEPEPTGPGDSSSTESDDDSHGPHVNTAGASSPQQQWWTNGLAFPCFLSGHDHEIGSCKEFLSMSANERRQASRGSDHKICWACLRPTMLCKLSCGTNPKAFEGLLCKSCKPYKPPGSMRNKAPLSIFFCTKEQHQKNRPQPSVVSKEIKKYLKVFPKGLDERAVVYANLGFVCSTSIACNCVKGNCKHGKPKTSPPTPSGDTPVIDTETGDFADLEKVAEITDSEEEACLLMQWIRIGKSNCLVMFDRGANVNLIDGNLAERENLQVVSDQPSGVKVVGGGARPPQSLVNTKWCLGQPRLGNSTRLSAMAWHPLLPNSQNMT